MTIYASSAECSLNFVLLEALLFKMRCLIILVTLNNLDVFFCEKGNQHSWVF